MIPGLDPTMAMLAGMAAVVSTMSGIAALPPIAAAGVNFLESKRERAPA